MNYRHGHYIGKRSRTYNSWENMKKRCTDPKHRSYPAYGGSGVKCCERWLSFEAFLSDMGSAPDGTTLDRKDSAKDYEPGNCRWATPTEQAVNRKSTILVEFNGETLALKHAAERAGLRYATVRKRLGNGWSIYDALHTAPMRAEIRARLYGDPTKEE